MNNDNGEEVEASEESAQLSEYVTTLLREKILLNPEQHGHAMRLIDQEVQKAQVLSGKYKPEHRYVDVTKEKPIKVVTKVLVPVKEHPRFNFVGKLLGPKGNSLKRLQEETMTKMAILGKGSMRDKTKEEELRTSLEPKYGHLSDDLHVEIVSIAPPAEAYARVAFALAEIRKFMIPDVNDDIRQEQMREIQQFGGPPRGRGGPGGRGMIRGRGGPPRPGMMPPRGMPPPMGGPRMGPGPGGKSKVISILDRARAAMEENYQYDDGYFDPSGAGYNPGGFGPGYNGSNYYDGPGYEDEDETQGGGGGGNWGGYGGAKKGGMRGGKMVGNRFGNRPTPYQRPAQAPIGGAPPN